MKLAAKFITVLLLGILALMVLAEYISLRHENEQMNQDMKSDARQLGKTISEIVDEIWQLSGRPRALRVLRDIDAVSKTRSVRLVYLDVPKTHPDHPVVPYSLRRFQQQITTFTDKTGTGEEHLFTYARLLTTETRPAAIELSEPMTHIKENANYSVLHALALMAATTLLGAVLAVGLGASWIGRPLRKLIDKTRRIGRGDLSDPLRLNRTDEFGELAKALNAMCEQLHEAQDQIHAEAAARVAALEQLRHVDRLRTIGRLAAGIAHELGTPLNVISGRASLIATGLLKEAEIQDSARIIKSESDRITVIIRQLLDFARRNTPQRKEIDVVQLIRQTENMLAAIAEKNNCQLQLADHPDRCRLPLDAGQIQQVLTNLIVNAIESMPSGGAVEVSLSEQNVRPPEGIDAKPGSYLRVDVRDHGEGISDDLIKHIFEPFFTTKEVGEGTGLGLSIAHGIVQEHGGWIDVSSRKGKGSCFSVYLPMGESECKDES